MGAQVARVAAVTEPEKVMGAAQVYQDKAMMEALDITMVMEVAVEEPVVLVDLEQQVLGQAHQSPDLLLPMPPAEQVVPYMVALLMELTAPPILATVVVEVVDSMELVKDLAAMEEQEW
jgi:hypothetical protein